MRNHKIKSRPYLHKYPFSILAAVLCAILLWAAVPCPVSAVGSVDTARPSVNGRLRVEGSRLVDAAGESVQLRGVSTHGLTWYPDYLDEGLFRQLSEDWNCNMIRLAMYSAIYSGGGQKESDALLRRGIEAAIAADMYVLVDWHILEDADPNQNLDAAAAFFDRIAGEYADCPNLLFEICNEPNGETDWGDVIQYSEAVIPVIRKHIPDAVIVVGTPEYDRNLGGALLRPLSFDNVLYVLHFYAASHQDGLRGELRAAVDAGLPVFISECGICESNGDGRIDFSSAAEWFRYLNENKISYAVWSLSDKDESSAFFKPGFDPSGPIRDEDLTDSGLWVRELIRGADPEEIPVSADVIEKTVFTRIRMWITRSLGDRGFGPVKAWPVCFGIGGGILLLLGLCELLLRGLTKRQRTYEDIVGENGSKRRGKAGIPLKLCLILSAYAALIYLCWRIGWSVPFEYGVLAVTANLLLLAVEILGFAESLILFRNLLGLRTHPLPTIPADAWPEVDVFIATYNEPKDLLRRTVNGCKHMVYPDPSKVHIWICDDNRRPSMRALAEEMGVGYFDRPDNEGAKAGNLNHALGLTGAPYVVTFDADMIPKSDFLLKTIPYFVNAELCEKEKPASERLHLGLLQTPQSFYDPDVFQHALYSEKRAPNEQDFFYRTIEVAKTSTNSVIYGGSNTVLSRAALEAIGGFYTGSITEDFATGLLIESAGYVSLALPEPLASGQTPHTFREHIQQRIRWARGVIVTAKKLKIWPRKELTFLQKISYWSSVSYWYSPFKSWIYMLSPILYAVFAIPVFRCSWLELLLFWLPMFILQDLSLRLYSGNAVSSKWSGIYETCIMPYLLIPVLKESMGISLSKFKVTDKSKRSGKRKSDLKMMIPFLVLIAFSAAGIVRIVAVFEPMQTVSYLILLFWIIRNLYFLLMAVFLADGRDDDGEAVRVTDAEPVTVRADGVSYDGVTTLLTEHNLTVFLDEGQSLGLGKAVEVTVWRGDEEVTVRGVVTGIREARTSEARTQTIEILDFGGAQEEYWQLLYDRIPTLPQSLQRDFGVLSHLWQNIAHRVARTRK